MCWLDPDGRPDWFVLFIVWCQPGIFHAVVWKRKCFSCKVWVRDPVHTWQVSWVILSQVRRCERTQERIEEAFRSNHRPHSERRTCLYAYSKEAICNRCCETGTCRVWPGPEFYLPCRVNDLCMTQAAWLGRADGCVVGGDKSQGATEVTELNSRVISNTVVSLCCGV